MSIITIAKEVVFRQCLFICCFVCLVFGFLERLQKNYWTQNLDEGQTPLTFGVDLVKGTDLCFSI